MHLARVTGTVVASTITPGLEGTRLLILQPLDRKLEPRGSAVVAADAVAMAGPDELVYYVASREAAVAMPESFVPIDHAVIGIADAVHEVES
jgi:microcompartment protein CcmK/EutM